MHMKKNIILYMAAVAGLVLAGCNKESVMPQGGSLDMTVTASVGEMTKVAYDGLKTTFTKDDSLSVYAWIGSNTEVAEQLVVNGVVNKLDEKGKWVPASQMLWKNARDDHYFIGISPAHEVVSFTADPFVLNPAEYKTNDLLIANDLKGQKVTTDLAPNPVSLTFTHALAKLNVHLKFRSQWAATPTVTSVATTAMNCYKVNYLTKAVTAYGDAAQVALQPLTTTPQGYALSFSGLQVPQTGVTVITIKIDGKDFVYTAAEPIVLESGKITNIGLIVGREELFLDKTSVEDWAEGQTYTEDGEAELSAPGTKAADATAEDLGKVIGANGNIYADADAAIAAGTTALAVICYVGNDAETSTTYNHGLALALADANGGNKAAWSSVAANCLDKQYGPGDDPTVNMSGIANTDMLVGDGHDHDAASAARNYNGGTYPAGTSEWFLPSAGQWQKMISAAGSYATLVSNVNLKSTTDPYWSSTEKGNGSAWTYAYGKWDTYGGTSFYVRACLAF